MYVFATGTKSSTHDLQENTLDPKNTKGKNTIPTKKKTEELKRKEERKGGRGRREGKQGSKQTNKKRKCYHKWFLILQKAEKLKTKI